MATDQSGVRWPAWPLYGAVGANGNFDPVAETVNAANFTLTPSGQAEQENAAQIRELSDVPAELTGEVPGDEGPQ